MIPKQNGENPLVMVGIRDIKHMFVLHLKVLYYLTHLQQQLSTRVKAPVLLKDIQDRNVLFSIADAAYNSQHIYKIAETCDIFPVNPINLRNGEQIKSTYRRVLSHFVQTINERAREN